jgi:hypothetical protein
MVYFDRSAMVAMILLGSRNLNSMKTLLIMLATILPATIAMAQSPVGKWKKVAHISEYGGETMDTHAALLSQRPCAADILYEVNTDGTFRLNASKSSCDESYKDIQQRLYAKTQWRVKNNIITISATNFAVGQSYTLRLDGNTMIWIGTEGQGTIKYRRQ